MPDLSLVVTCHGKCPELDALMACLDAQEQYAAQSGGYRPAGSTPHTLEIVITSDGPYGGNPRHLERPDVVLVTNPKEGGVGHHTRGPGIEAASGDWISLTNADNLYCYGFLHTVCSHTADGHGMVYWDVINSLWKFTNNRGSRLKRACIDLGCAAVRAEVAKRVGFPWRNYDGDYDFIESCMNLCAKAGLGISYIPQALYIHN